MPALSIRSLLFATLAPLALSSACASAYLEGSTIHADGAPARATVFDMGPCTTVAGQMVAAPQISYHLADEGGVPVLYEIPVSGKGARITNSWRDQDGLHFFVWVKTGPGWEYIFPTTPGVPATRRIFNKFTYGGVDGPNGERRPSGNHAATCPLTQRPG